MEYTDELRCRVALSFLTGVGPVAARNLVSYCGSANAVFRQKPKALEKIPEVGIYKANLVKNREEAFRKADDELDFIRKYKIQPLFFTDDAYPSKLRHCNDAPLMLYYKGNADLNRNRIIGIVGTRSATGYGRAMTESIINGLAVYGVTVVSGLAYGIDITAHRLALENNLPTIGVMAHGHDRLYPDLHKGTAVQMIESGGLITEYPSGTNPDRENFPSRNRIVAGMCDAIIVIEAAIKGGALITADIANSYNRDVFAVPGRVKDEFSIGCNNLIRMNKAALATSAEDIAYIMSWENPLEAAVVNSKSIQKKLFIELTPEEKILEDLLKDGKMNIDSLSIRGKIPFGKLSSLLLNLEMNGVIRALPGKYYELL